MSRRLMAYALAALGCVVAVACSSSNVNDPAAPPPEPVDEASVPYNGPAGGNPPQGEGGSFIPIEAGLEGSPGDAAVPCCNVNFSIVDATGDETTARLTGDFGPLTGAGVPLTYSGGRWRATACIPVGTYLRYQFHFGKVFQDPASGGGALVDDNRYNPNLPTIADGMGSYVNVLDPFSMCSEIDAGPPTNNDGLKNGTETDIDCGGGAPTNAPMCAVGQICKVVGDCTSALCTPKGICSTAGRLYVGVFNSGVMQSYASASAANGMPAASTSVAVTKVGGIGVDGPRDTAYVASFDGNAIHAYAPASTSNGAPARTISGITQPWGVAVDSAGDRLFATSFADVINIYDGASGLNGAGGPTRQITGITANYAPYGIAYDASRDRLFVSLRGGNRIVVFDKASIKNGAFASVVSRTIVGAATKLNSPSQIAYDAARDELYVANVDAFTTGQGVVFASASTANGNVAPARTINTTGFNEVSGVTLDVTRDELYISTMTQLLVPVFANANTLNGAAATSRQIQGLTQFATQLAFDPTRN